MPTALIMRLDFDAVALLHPTLIHHLPLKMLGYTNNHKEAPLPKHLRKVKTAHIYLKYTPPLF